MQHQFAAPLERSASKLFNWQLRVPADTTAAFLATESGRRVICSLNASEPYQCALTPIGDGVYVLTVNQGRIKKLKLEEGVDVSIDLFPDDSKYGLPMAEELDELLRQDEEGNALFHALSAGKLRTLLYIVNQGVDSDDRLRRAVVVVDHLHQHSGKINYKALHAEL